MNIYIQLLYKYVLSSAREYKIRLLPKFDNNRYFIINFIINFIIIKEQFFIFWNYYGKS